MKKYKSILLPNGIIFLFALTFRNDNLHIGGAKSFFVHHTTISESLFFLLLYDVCLMHLDTNWHDAQSKPIENMP